MLLASGALSDCRVATPHGEFALHSVVLATRCQYLWTALGRRAQTPTAYRLDLPAPLLESDGPWERADFERLFWHMYATETQWEKDWASVRAALARGGLMAGSVLQAWLRLHRLADFFQYEVLVQQIEQLLLVTGLNTWTRATALLHLKEPQHYDPTAFLLPRVQELLEACAAASESRARIARGTLLWLLSFGASVYPNPEEARAAWLAALRAAPWCDRAWYEGACGGSGHPSALVAPDASLVTLCHACCASSRGGCGDDDDDDDGREQQDPEFLWSLLLVGQERRVKALPPNEDLLIDCVYANTKSGARSYSTTLRRRTNQEHSANAAAAADTTRAEHAAEILLFAGHAGRCQVCGVLSETLHMWVLCGRPAGKEAVKMTLMA